MPTDNSKTPEAEAEDQSVIMESQINGKESLNEIKAFLQQQAMDSFSHDEREDYLECFVEDYSTFSAASLNKINKWEEASGTPGKLYFSLSEAASITDLDQTALLNAGGRAAITLCTPLPPGVRVAPFYKGAAGYPIEQPELLVLSDADCRSIELNGFATQSDFERGYAFSFSEATCIFPGYRNLNYMYKGSTWKTFTNNYPTMINILSDQLLITRAGLCKFLDSQLPHTKEKHGSQPSEEIKHKKTPINCKTPPEFITAINKLLELIKERAEEKGLEFNRNNMPGKKEDLHELAIKIDPQTFAKSKQTFDDYLRGICKFKQGRSQANAPNPYAELFPEYFSKKEISA